MNCLLVCPADHLLILNIRFLDLVSKHEFFSFCMNYAILVT